MNTGWRRRRIRGGRSFTLPAIFQAISQGFVEDKVEEAVKTETLILLVCLLFCLRKEKRVVLLLSSSCYRSVLFRLDCKTWCL